MDVIRGKKALITGAGSGIGKAIALALAREGADLWLMGRNQAKLDATAKAARALGVEAVTSICDLAESSQLDAAAEAIVARWQRLDILINNAGTAHYGPVSDVGAELSDEILAVNLLAPIRLTHALLPALLAQPQANIVNVASIFGLASGRKLAHYQASKFGLVGFSTALAGELGRRNFGVTTLCPGFVRTPMLEDYGAAGRRHTLPSWATVGAEQVAAAAIRAIYRNKSIVVVSLPAKLLWWANRIAPNAMTWLMREGWRH